MGDPSNTVEQHFLGKPPEVRALYDQLRRSVSNIGQWIEDPKKTSIHFNRRTAFAGVAIRRESIVLTVKANREIASQRIVKSQHNSASRWHHEVKITQASDIDAELVAWLHEAYELSA